MMMSMSTTARTGLYMGAWTLAQALANGTASIGGGWLHDGVLAIGGAEPLAYASVFIVESLGLLVALGMLARVQAAAFHRETLRPTPA